MDLRSRSLLIFILPLFLTSYFFLQESKPTVYLIGDSTMADKPLDDNPEHGWGQVFPNFFTDAIKFENHAKNGRSTKSFINEGLWQAVTGKIKPGDYLFIQFGHNDSKISDTTRNADPHTIYKANLIKFIQESRAKGAIPVLLTPVNSRKFDEKGNFIDQHGDYTAVVREISKEFNVPLIDLHAKSLKLFTELGPEATKNLFLHFPPGIYKSNPKGREDDTHFSRAGAVKIASLVVEGLKELILPIAKMLKPVFETSTAGENKVVGLDYWYNHELKNDKNGNPYQYHYIWEDKENSGFYELGNIIENLGARIYEVNNAPTESELNKLSVYIIVDPDTPQETPQPNYISDSTASVIAGWVKQGGVLLLLGNDIGNCEFEHLNRLSERFGIHFNEVSRNRVTGNNFDMGKFDQLPNHPVFNGVKKIYMKEISTFRLTRPALPVLTEGGDVIIASSEFGKGLVVAVGDPWLYNEYIDNRKLPADFENYKAGVNLFKWLIWKSNSINASR